MSAVKFYLRKVRLDRGGYDSSGFYWGVGLLYSYESEDGTLTGHLRAIDRAEAKTRLTEKYATARFFR